MSITDRIIRNLIFVALVCSWTIEARSQSQKRGSTIRGTAVYSDTGRPLRHAHVSLYARGSKWQANTGTDLRGHFAFENVPEGKYLLVLAAPGLLSPISNLPQVDQIVPEPPYLDEGELTTEVTVNGTDSVDLKVKAVRGGVITGKVVTDDDQPLPNANINLMRRENGKWVPVWSTWADGGEKGGRITNAGGVYRIAGLPSGDYLVRASEPLIPSNTIPGDEEAYSDGSFMVAYHPAATAVKDAQAVSVVAGKESTGIDIRITERAPHTLMGTVTTALLQAPGSGVQITIERSDEIGFTMARGMTTARADYEGKWRVDGLPTGEYLVTLTGGAVKIDADNGVDFIKALRKRIPLRITGDEKIKVLNTTLSLGAQVAGRVTLNGKPIDETWIFTALVKPADDATAENIKRNDPGEVPLFTELVSRTGKFSITALRSGNYWFMLDWRETDAVYVKSVTRKGVDLMQAPFKLAEEEMFDDVVVTLATDLAHVEAQVTLPDGAGKDPVSDFMVIVTPANEATRRFNSGTRTLEADARGKLVFKSGPGEYLIAAVTTAEYKKIAREIDNRWLDKNADKFLRIKVRAGEKIKGLAVPMMGK